MVFLNWKGVSILALSSALALLLAAECALRWVGLSRLLNWVSRHWVYGRISERVRIGPGFAVTVRGCIDSVDRHLPGLKPSCLRRALAVRLLGGNDVAIRIGVRRIPGGRIEAHAWTGEPDVDCHGFQEMARI